MYRMFNACSELKEINIEDFNTSKVIDMRFMFNGCKSLIDINIHNFVINNKCCIRWMFSNTSKELKNKIKEQNLKISNLGFEDYLIE